MKKLMVIILSLVLVLSGCTFGGNGDPVEVTVVTEPPVTEAPTEAPTEVPTEAPTEAPTETVQETYPANITVEVLMEGEPYQLPMELFDGGDYVIYIPEDTWVKETYTDDGLIWDHWSYDWEPEVWFEVISFGPVTPEEAENILWEKGLNFEKTEEGDYIIHAASNIYMTMDIYTDGNRTFAMMDQMPVEFGDGFAPRFRAMINSFEIK